MTNWVGTMTSSITASLTSKIEERSVGAVYNVLLYVLPCIAPCVGNKSDGSIALFIHVGYPRRDHSAPHSSSSKPGNLIRFLCSKSEWLYTAYETLRPAPRNGSR